MPMGACSKREIWNFDYLPIVSLAFFSLSLLAWGSISQLRSGAFPRLEWRGVGCRLGLQSTQLSLFRYASNIFTSVISPWELTFPCRKRMQNCPHIRPQALSLLHQSWKYFKIFIPFHISFVATFIGITFWNKFTSPPRRFSKFICRLITHHSLTILYNCNKFFAVALRSRPKATQNLNIPPKLWKYSTPTL